MAKKKKQVCRTPAKTIKLAQCLAREARKNKHASVKDLATTCRVVMKQRATARAKGRKAGAATRKARKARSTSWNVFA